MPRDLLLETYMIYRTVRRSSVQTLIVSALFATFMTPVWAQDPPIPDARMCAEWEPAVGTLIRWPLGIPAALVVELAMDDSLYILVETAGQENQARASFASWGVNLSHCRFIYAETYSHWTRDWGPHSVFDGAGDWGILDPVFDGYPWVPGCSIEPPTASLAPPVGDRYGARGYEEDDAVNAVLAQEFNCQLFQLPAYFTGGNVMVDGVGTAFSTVQMADENAPWWELEEFLALLTEYAGITRYNLIMNPDLYGLQHIDCWAKLLDEETILIKKLPESHPEHSCIEAVVEQIESLTSCYGRPYRIHRVYCDPYNGQNTAAYTNSLILNGKVLVPLFGVPSDENALSTYEEAMPGYEVIGIPYANWYYYDALHCRTMGVFDRHMLRILHRRLDEEVWEQADYEITVMIDDRSEMGLIPDSLAVLWRPLSSGPWHRVPLLGTAGVDSFSAIIPGQGMGATVEYYIVAADSSGRRETLPRAAPGGTYRFTISQSMGDVSIQVIADQVYLEWPELPGATAYRVYSSQYPFHGFTLDNTGVFNGSSWVAPAGVEQRYYYVSAIAD
jgi:agmatine/peptidylarginine deiminase